MAGNVGLANKFLGIANKALDSGNSDIAKTAVGAASNIVDGDNPFAKMGKNNGGGNNNKLVMVTMSREKLQQIGLNAIFDQGQNKQQGGGGNGFGSGFAEGLKTGLNLSG